VSLVIIIFEGSKRKKISVDPFKNNNLIAETKCEIHLMCSPEVCRGPEATPAGGGVFLQGVILILVF